MLGADITLTHSLTHWLRLLAALGDQAVVLPLVLIVAIALLGLGERRAAFWWCVAVVVALGGTLLAKLIFIPCGSLVPDLGIRSPSGNVAAAAAVYGGLIMLFAQGRRGGADWDFGRLLGPILLLLLLVTAMSVSRVVTRAHTVPEAILGAMIGALSPILLALPRRMFVGMAIPRSPWLVLVPLIAVALFFGAKAQIEGEINFWAIYLAAKLDVCADSPGLDD